jgi:hypothetical protein
MRSSPKEYRLLQVLNRYEKRYEDARYDPNMDVAARMRAVQRYTTLDAYFGRRAFEFCSTYSDFN